jgi:hypothetical protein
MSELEPEEIAKIKSQVPIGGMRNIIDPDSQDRRRAAAKLQLETYRREQERYFKESEEALAKQRHLDKLSSDALLKQRGWKRFPLPPNEKFYHEEKCPFGCRSTVMFWILIPHICKNQIH